VSISQRNQKGNAAVANRRASVTFTFWCNSLLYTATVSYFANGDLAEIFLQNAKAGSHSDAAAKDSAVACSIAPVDVIRKALLRDSRGVASSQLGCLLDMLTADGENVTVCGHRVRRTLRRKAWTAHADSQRGSATLGSIAAIDRSGLKRGYTQ
jgi:hypothetical protein